MPSKNLMDRIASCFIGLGIGIGARLLSQDYNSTSYFVGFSLAGAGGVLIPSVKGTGKDEVWRGLACSWGSYTAGYFVTDYLLKTTQ
ncbi:long-chain fatty acid--CoA ligase [Candidatus Woesearchaeota archaeon]|nr:long-chain fatty acid--CoA ligase [Candidatus Woesearchaeota archaeon]